MEEPTNRPRRSQASAALQNQAKQLAAAHWAARRTTAEDEEEEEGKIDANDVDLAVVASIYQQHLSSFHIGACGAFEVTQYLEKYLWPGFVALGRQQQQQQQGRKTIRSNGDTILFRGWVGTHMCSRLLPFGTWLYFVLGPMTL